MGIQTCSSPFPCSALIMGDKLLQTLITSILTGLQLNSTNEYRLEIWGQKEAAWPPVASRTPPLIGCLLPLWSHLHPGFQFPPNRPCSRAQPRGSSCFLLLLISRGPHLTHLAFQFFWHIEITSSSYWVPDYIDGLLTPWYKYSR